MSAVFTLDPSHRYLKIDNFVGNAMHPMFMHWIVVVPGGGIWQDRWDLVCIDGPWVPGLTQAAAAHTPLKCARIAQTNDQQVLQHFEAKTVRPGGPHLVLGLPMYVVELERIKTRR